MSAEGYTSAGETGSGALDGDRDSPAAVFLQVRPDLILRPGLVSGKKELLAITLDEDVVDPEDIEMLQDLIVAAVNEAMKKADEEQQKLMGGIGGLGGFGF